MLARLRLLEFRQLPLMRSLCVRRSSREGTSQGSAGQAGDSRTVTGAIPLWWRGWNSDRLAVVSSPALWVCRKQTAHDELTLVTLSVGLHGSPVRWLLLSVSADKEMETWGLKEEWWSWG